MTSTNLPIEPQLPAIVAALGDPGAVVVVAPPGAGKTTRVPIALLDEPWTTDGRLVVLEPRRLAARASARRMARLLGDEVGGVVGVVTRDDRRVSSRTRIEVVTEGVLVRRLQRDPGLPGICGVLLDEFHERSLEADLALALSVEARAALREDLRLGVMSATLAGEPVVDLIGDAALVTSEGREHPVETRYLPRPRRTARIEPDVVEAVRTALAATDAGDLLVFLPGAGEIRRVARDLGASGVGGPSLLVTPLYGALPPDEQDRALDPAPPGVRKVVLATDIAETSLTIDGVRVVVDSGLTREPRFDPNTGMSRLVTVPVSRASADQRRGRAGRTAPGVCYRLWSEAEHHALEAFTAPAIAKEDLTGFALEIAAWGADGPDDLRLLDPPPTRAYGRAVELLTQLDALDERGGITDHGREVAGLPVHPRLGHMIVRASTFDLAGVACDLAALIGDRDVLITSWEHPCADAGVRHDLLHDRGGPPGGVGVRRGALRRARQQARRLRRSVGSGSEPGPSGRAGLALAPAFPDRIAQRRPGRRGDFLLSNGRGATLPDGDALAGENLLVVADVDAGTAEARVYLAAALDRDELELALGDDLEDEEVVAWDQRAGDVVAERRTRLGELVLDRVRIDAAGDERTVAALLDGVRQEGLRILPWTRQAHELRARIHFLHRHLGGGWPDLSDEVLLGSLESWLGPFLLRARRRADLEDVPLVDALRALVPPELQGRLDELAPTHLSVPSGSRIRVDYGSRDVPVLPVRVQEMFGARRTPRVAGGEVPVLLRLLSPARRPVQVTDDLAGFWERTYGEVRSELRGRYPKHHWPEDPYSARPRRGVR